MAHICIPSPSLDEYKTVDVQVTIDGRQSRTHYRVETFDWPRDEHARLDALRAFIASRGEEWLLVQIGSPANDCVPLLFRLRSSESRSISPIDHP